jgi:hypothetical protein
MTTANGAKNLELLLHQLHPNPKGLGDFINTIHRDLGRGDTPYSAAGLIFEDTYVQ